MRKRTIALITTIVGVTLVLAGCAQPAGTPGTDPGPGGPPSNSVPTSVNAADQMFVIMMIPHHQQAIAMADIVLEKDGVDQRVLDLAQQIKDAQEPEIQTMEGWLDSWGVGVSMPGGMSGGDGMMSDDDMDALEAAEGTEAGRLFLEQMMVHHEGAINLARGAVSNGQNPDVIALAEQIIATQADEIAIMQELLTTI